MYSWTPAGMRGMRSISARRPSDFRHCILGALGGVAEARDGTMQGLVITVVVRRRADEARANIGAKVAVPVHARLHGFLDSNLMKRWTR